MQATALVAPNVHVRPGLVARAVPRKRGSLSPSRSGRAQNEKLILTRGWLLQRPRPGSPTPHSPAPRLATSRSHRLRRGPTLPRPSSRSTLIKSKPSTRKGTSSGRLRRTSATIELDDAGGGQRTTPAPPRSSCLHKTQSRNASRSWSRGFLPTPTATRRTSLSNASPTSQSGKRRGQLVLERTVDTMYKVERHRLERAFHRELEEREDEVEEATTGLETTRSRNHRRRREALR